MFQSMFLIDATGYGEEANPLVFATSAIGTPVNSAHLRIISCRPAKVADIRVRDSGVIGAFN